MKKFIIMLTMGASISSLYASNEAPKKQPAHCYDIRYEYLTIKGEDGREKTGLFYNFYGTQGPSTGMHIGFIEDFSVLTANYDLSEKQLEQIANQQARYIKGLEYVYQQLEVVNKTHVELSERSKKANKEILNMTKMTAEAQTLAENAHNASLYKSKIIKNAIRLVDLGIALGLSMCAYQWYGAQ